MIDARLNILHKKICYVCIQLILLLIEGIICNNIERYDFQFRCYVLAIFVILNLVTQIIGLYRLNRLFSVGGMLIIFSYLVNCSHMVLMAFDLFTSDSVIYTVFFKRFNKLSFYDASQYALFGISFIFIGYIFFIKEEKNDNIITFKPNNKMKFMKQYGIILSIIFGSIYLLQMIFSISSSLSAGSYHVQSELGESFFIRIARNLESFFLEGMFIMMLYYKLKGEIKKSKVVLTVTVIMFGLYCLTGVRSRPVMLLLILIILWMKDITIRVKKRYIILLLLGGLLVLQFLMSIRETRGMEFSLNNIVNTFFSIDNNILYETLNEFGSSIFVTAGFMEGHYSGKPWEVLIREFCGIFPSISSWGGEVFLSATVRSGFEERYALGCTYVAEFYYYFGNIGQVLMAFWGIWICLIDNFVDKLRNQGRYLSIAIAIPGMVTVLNSTRASLSLGLKMFLYSWLIYVAICAILNRGKVRLDI